MADSLERFAQVLGLESEAIAFLREYPAELQGAIIAGFDASGSKDGNVLGRLQSYSRHLAKRTASNTASMVTSASKGNAGNAGGPLGKETRKYNREILLLHWEQTPVQATDGDSQVLKAMPVPPARSNSKKGVDGSTKETDRRTPSPEVASTPPAVQPLKARTAPPAEAPPPPPPPQLPPQVDGAPSDADPVVVAPALAPRSQEPVAMADRAKLIRPAALDAALEQTPVRKAEHAFGVPSARPGLNADAPEFVPGMQAPFSPAAQLQTPTVTPKAPRTPLSLAATIAGPEEPPSPPPRSPLLRGLPPVFGIPPMSPLTSPWTAAPPPTPAEASGPNASDDEIIQVAPPPLQRSVTTPVGHVAAPPSSPEKSVKSTFEYHLHRLLYMLVARRCNESEAPTEEKGLLVNSIRAEWAKVYGSDMEALMEKCGHKEVEPLVRKIDGLRVVGDGLDLRVITTSTEAPETASAPAPTTAPPTPSASRHAVGPAGALGATVASSNDTATSTATTVPSVIGAGRRKPPPPPPAAPPPALLGIGGLLGGPLGANSAAVGSGTPKVLSLDQHVESPAGKMPLGLDKFVPEAPSGQTLSDPLSQWGALSFGNSPGMLWNPQGWPSESPNGAATLWYPGCPAPPNGPPLSAGPALAAEADVGPPPAHDAPTLEPLSSSAF
mmetsp:Transcript_97992/g.169757  ORF Transcript_97992/g.169757 Transcript_97992/m.169757 type:complete len:668 (-) Transcript_97992:78-2081(-)